MITVLRLPPNLVAAVAFRPHAGRFDMRLKVAAQRVPGLREVAHFARATFHRGGGEHSQWARIIMNQETDRLLRNSIQKPL
jgi:hypothetical protein